MMAFLQLELIGNTNKKERKMNFKFNRRKIKYVVKPEEKMVIGWIDMCDEAKNITSVGWEMRNFNIDYLLFPLGVEDIWQQEERVLKAVSKCDDRDEFNEKIGKKIVADVLEKKYHILMMKKFKQLERKFKEIGEYSYALGMMHEKRLKELQARIDEYNKE